MAHPTTRTVVFDQCRTNLRMVGALVKKATLLIANADELLEPFQNLRCTGRHDNAPTCGQGGALAQAQVWTWQFAEHIVDAIVKLKSKLKKLVKLPQQQLRGWQEQPSFRRFVQQRLEP